MKIQILSHMKRYKHLDLKEAKESVTKKKEAKACNIYWMDGWMDR